MYLGPVQESESIKYCSGFKYQLREDAWFFVGIYPEAPAITDLVILRSDGWLNIKKYFAWDGCTFPAIDDKTNSRGCLIHDALYYLMRVGMLPESSRKQADALLKQYMIRDGAWPFRAAYYEMGVNLCGGKAACVSSVRKIIVAP